MENNNSKKKKMDNFDYEELEAATESFSCSLLIGKGSHGCVYKGVLEDGRVVAIKKQSLGLQKLHDNSKLENEALILSSLPKSPHLINLLGTSHDNAKNKLLVMEFMPYGSLHDLLHSSSNPPTWPARARVVLQVARAVKFLHEADTSIIHRDIKSANILFDSDWTAKLADFGLAISLETERVNSASQPAGTIGYLDPCYDTPWRLSTKNDVYSFGVVLLEIISGTKAIDVSRVPSSIVEWALQLIEEDRVTEIWDKRVVLTNLHMEGTVRGMISIAARCVTSREDDRPSMGEIVLEIEKGVVERVRAPIWIDVLRGVLKRKWKIIARRRKCACNSSTSSCVIPAPHEGKGNGEFSKRKIMLLREVLADITLS